jgi:hypothetical protein
VQNVNRIRGAADGREDIESRLHKIEIPREGMDGWMDPLQRTEQRAAVRRRYAPDKKVFLKKTRRKRPGTFYLLLALFLFTCTCIKLNLANFDQIYRKK